MAFKISDLNTVLNKNKGVARACHYEVIIKAPTAIAAANADNLNALSVLCENVQLPGRSFATTPQMIYGVSRKMPYGVLYDDLNMTFICTDSMKERIFFETWQSAISSPTNNYFRYYNDYIGEFHIIKLDKSNSTAHFVVCEEAWPMTIQPQELSYSDTDSYLKLGVSFAYRRWLNAANFTDAGLQIPVNARSSEIAQFFPGQPFCLPSTPDDFDALGEVIKTNFAPLGVDVQKILRNISDFLGLPFLGG